MPEPVLFSQYKEPVRRWLTEYQAKHGEAATMDMLRLLARVIAWMAQEGSNR